MYDRLYRFLLIDPWGGDTTRSSNEAFQPRRFTTYDRDGNSSDEAMHRRYNRWHSRFDQPDPYGGSYDMTNPQSFNRYSYVQNDPVNFVDPTGLDKCPDGTVAQADALGEMQCVGAGRQSVDINISGGGRRSGGVGGTSSGAIEIETGGNGPTEAEIVPQNTQPLPTDLKDKVANIVNNPKTDCAEFIKKLIGNLKGKAFSDDPMKLFERVENEKGFRLGNTGKYAGLAGITSGKRKVTIRPVSSSADPRLSEHQAYAYAVTALNELMHHAKNSGVYSDRDLARAISKLQSPDQLAANPLPKTNDVDTNSAYFHSLFNLHCRSLTGE